MCGNPIWICRNESAANVGFKIKTVKCFAKAEMDKHTEREQKKKKNRKAYGEQEVVVPYTYDNGDFPSRASYYQSLYEEHAADN